MIMKYKRKEAPCIRGEYVVKTATSVTGVIVLNIIAGFDPEGYR